MANVTKVYKNWPAYDDDLANKAYVDSVVEDLANGDISSIKKAVAKNTQDISTAQTDIVNLNNTKLNTSVYDTFISDQYNPLVVKVDGKIESYYQSTDPSINWITGLEKNSHVGDIWYDTTTQKTYVYYKDSSTSPVTYFWQWQNVPIELIDSVNGKAKIFSGVIPTNYEIGDYWLIPLDCFTNSYNLTNQIGEYDVNTKITLGPYTFVVDSVDSSNAIVTYHMDVPNISNFDLSETLTDGNITVDITSVSSFTLPDNCYGGSICVATSAGTSYDSTKWLNRNDYIPQDKADRFALETDLNDNVNTLNNTINSNVIDINNSIRDNVDTLNGTIQNNYDDLDGAIKNNKDLTDLDIANLRNEDSNIRTTYDGQVQRIDNEMIALEDRIVRNIRNTSGGNNLLKNSVGFKNQSHWDISSNTYSEQKYYTLANKEITVSFRYKKPNLVNGKIVLGYYVGSTFTEVYTVLDTSDEITNWRDVTFTYISSINNPCIRINGEFTGVQDNDAENNSVSGSKLVCNNGLEITDLIIGYGQGKGWSPYFNELYGKTFNLDLYGFDMLDLASNKNIHLDTNSLDFKNSNNYEAIFSKTITLTDGVYVNDSINIGNFTNKTNANDILQTKPILKIAKLDNNNIIEY